MSEQKKRPNIRLKQEREIRGWSQEDLAEKVGTTQKIVSRWERGDSRPLPYYRQKLCQLFDKSTKELGFLDDSPETDSQIAPVSEESSPAQSVPDTDVYGYKPIQVLVPDNANCVVTIHNALELLDPTLMRRQPTYLADLASVDIRQGEIEEACERANQAVAIAVQIKSQMVTERLLTLRRELEPWKNMQHVKNLDEHLAPLLPTLHRGNI